MPQSTVMMSGGEEGEGGVSGWRLKILFSGS